MRLARRLWCAEARERADLPCASVTERAAEFHGGETRERVWLVADCMDADGWPLRFTGERLVVLRRWGV